MSSMEFVARALDAFVVTDQPRVLVLRGKWGVGKTHLWRTAVAGIPTDTPLKSYSYVSLFGVGSLRELKFGIFEQQTQLGSRADAAQATKYKKLLSQARRLPIVNRWVTADSIEDLAFATVNHALVCLDDLERRGRDLTPTDVLGLVSFLKEECDCRIALLLNEDELGDSAEEFWRHVEKVADTSIKLAPSPQELRAVALTDVEQAYRDYVGDACEALRIANIRVIRRVSDYVGECLSGLVHPSEALIRQVAVSLTLFVWSKLSPAEAPTRETLESYRPPQFRYRSDENSEDEHAKWDAQIEALGGWYADDLDKFLAEGVSLGYFDAQRLAALAAKIDEANDRAAKEAAFRSVWRRFHDRFGDDEVEFANDLIKAFRDGINYMTPGDLDGSVRILTDLDRNEAADALIKDYLEWHAANGTDWEDYPFEIKDKRVINAVEELRRQKSTSGDWRKGLVDSSRSTTADEASVLAALSIEEIEEFLFGLEKEERKTAIERLLRYGRQSDGEGDYAKIGELAESALRKIADRSTLNKLRVRRFLPN